MNKIETKENVKIEKMIYEIRGVQVMLDSNLAILYQCKNGTKEINQAVSRNIEKFPKRYSWILSNSYCDYLQSHFVTTNISSKSRSNPRVFTEQGVAMLATILKSQVATQVSINIMDTFVAMRKYISSNLIEQKYINNLVLENDSRLTLIENTLNKLNEKQKVNTIFFEGQIFDAYIFLLDLLNVAKEEIIIIDNFAGKELFSIIKDIKIKIIIVSKNIDDELVNKYKKQYNNIEIIINDSFHDRFIIIDKSILYHSGASFKDLGKKCFGINKIEDKLIINNLLKNLKL